MIFSDAETLIAVTREIEAALLSLPNTKSSTVLSVAMNVHLDFRLPGFMFAESRHAQAAFLLFLCWLHHKLFRDQDDRDGDHCRSRGAADKFSNGWIGL